MTRREKYEQAHPLVETHRGYEIRRSGEFFVAIISMAVNECTCETLEQARDYIDKAIDIMDEGHLLYGHSGKSVFRDYRHVMWEKEIRESYQQNRGRR